MVEHQDETLAFLGRGASYGNPAMSVERIDTHVSVVFLAGVRAFKLKRAIKYSYLDYSTLALRRHYCEAELALGRHMAPTLYRAVRAITREADGGLVFDGRGEPIDWVVEMRRFEQDALFDRLAEAHRLTPALMQELADEIAEFHGRAMPTYAFGGAAAIRAVIEDSCNNMRISPQILDGKQVDAVFVASMAALERIAPLLDRRREAGKVRRCHGDLHLRNICLLDGKPTLFDGIEFSEEIACIDLLYDLAFLFMDLHHRGFDDLGSRVFNRYFDRTGDVSGLAALPLFLSVRAGIRAHVTAAAVARQQHPEAAARTIDQARSYLSLAIDLLHGHEPRLVAVGGLSGTGKTTLAYGLAPDFAPVPGARVVRSDVLRKRLLDVAPETRLASRAYDHATTERVYHALYDEGSAALDNGYAAIADATFLRSEERHAIAAAARRAGVAFTGLWLEAPPEVLAQRLARRRGDASDADRAVLDRQLTYDVGPIDWHRIDAAADIVHGVAEARRFIRETAKDR